MSAHTPMRPLWHCRICLGDWPCRSARRDLLDEFRNDRTALLVYLSTSMIDAAAQLRQLNDQLPHADLADRFLNWARRDPDPTQGPVGNKTWTPVD